MVSPMYPLLTNNRTKSEILPTRQQIKMPWKSSRSSTPTDQTTTFLAVPQTQEQFCNASQPAIEIYSKRWPIYEVLKSVRRRASLDASWRATTIHLNFSVPIWPMCTKNSSVLSRIDRLVPLPMYKSLFRWWFGCCYLRLPCSHGILRCG